MVLRRDEGQRRAGHDVDDRGQLVRRRLRRGQEPGDRRGRGGEQQHPADDAVQRVQPELHPGDHAEVPAAAAQRPEQVRVLLGVRAHHPAVREHDVRREQVVDGQPVRAGQVADAAAERDPRDADRAGVPEPHGEPVRGRRGGDGPGGEAGLHPRGAGAGVHVEHREVAQVDDEPVVHRAVAGAAVPAAAHRERQPGVARERHRRRDVGVVQRAHHDGGARVGAAEHHDAEGVVVGVGGGDHPAADAGAEVVERGGHGHGGLLDDGGRDRSSVVPPSGWGQGVCGCSSRNARLRSSDGPAVQR